MGLVQFKTATEAQIAANSGNLQLGRPLVASDGNGYVIGEDGVPTNELRVRGLGEAFTGADSGVKNAYVVDLPYGNLKKLHDNVQVWFKPANSNDGQSTIDVSGLGVKDITRKNGRSLQVGDLNSNTLTKLVYNSADDCFEIEPFDHLRASEFTDLNEIITLAGSLPVSVYWDTEFQLTTDPGSFPNISVPETMTIQFDPVFGKVANPSGAVTCNWYGIIKADHYQNIFGEATQGNLTLHLQRGSTLFCSTNWFGAIPDCGLTGTLTVGTAGTDSTAFVNTCIQACQNRVSIWSPPGRYHASYSMGYRITGQILLETAGADQNGNEGDRFKSFKFIGGDFASSQSKSLFYLDFDYGCGINPQGVRSSEIAGLSIVGKNQEALDLKTAQARSGTWSITAGTSTVSGASGAALTELKPGHKVQIVDDDGDKQRFIVASVASDNSFDILGTFGGTNATSVTIYRWRSDIENYTTQGALISGTISVSNGSKNVTGVGTTFTSLYEGEEIAIVNDSGNIEKNWIDTITNDTNLVLTNNASDDSTAVQMVTYGRESGIKTALTGIGVDYNDSTGLSSPYGTKNLKIRDCLVQCCYVSFGHDMGGNPQGDTVSYQNIKSIYAGISMTSGGTQNRSVEINGFEFGYACTWFDNVTHGEVGGSFFNFKYGQVTNHAKYFNCTTAFGGEFMVRDVFGEFNGRVGIIGGANNGNPLTISGGQHKWDPNVFKSEVKFVDALTPLVFENLSLRMNSYHLFYFSNSKRTTFKDVKFTSDSGLPIIIGDQLTPNRIVFHDCIRFDNATDYREDLDHQLIIQKDDVGDYQKIQWWHRSIMVEGYNENQSLRNLERTRATILQHTSLSHDWAATPGSDVITLPHSHNTSREGHLFSMQSAEGDSVMMGEITDINYTTRKLTVTPLWHNWAYEGAPGTGYQYLQMYHFVGGMLGSIDIGVDDTALTIADASKVEVQDVLYLPSVGARRITAKPGGNVVTIHSAATQSLIDANISDVE